MKFMRLAVVAALATTATGAYAQDAAAGDDAVVIEDSFADNSERTFEVNVDDNSESFENSFNDNSNSNVNDNSEVFNDSFDDNSEVFNDSFDDNSEVFNDSFDDNSQVFTSVVGIASSNVFGDNAIVAEATLSNVVTGVDVNFGDVEDSAQFANQLTNSDNAFRNYAGMNALNQNTGTGASQNASVTIAVASDNFDVN
ncbi:MAG: hypothetical protein ABJP48_04850 [Erythrobacter sp.]